MPRLEYPIVVLGQPQHLPRANTSRFHKRVGCQRCCVLADSLPESVESWELDAAAGGSFSILVARSSENVQPPTIYHQGGPGDKARFSRGQETDRCGEVFRF